MSSKPSQTLADYVVVAVSPALIMLLVGSLVFFLTNIFYEGEFHGRLRFSCAMFVMAAVLIARISIDEGREYAGMFALPLAIVTMLSILRYTDAGVLLALPLIVAIWWSADKLTWDCTVVDDHKDASGEGLLQTIGLDGDEAEDEAAGAEGQAAMDLEASTSRKTEATSLWKKWVASRRRHHTPGVWVVYFSLASLPLFGVGQWLLPDSAAARHSSFRLLGIYVASALALLMTTSFLQLRRYLRQRRLQMPGDMARVWLGTGSIMIVGLVVSCLLLPLPNTESALSEYVSRLASRDRLRSSRFALGDEGTTDAESGQPSARERDDGSRDARDGEGQSPPEANGENGERSSEGRGEQRQTDSGDRSSESPGGGQQTHDQQADMSPSSDQSNSQSTDGRTSEPPPSETAGDREKTSPNSEQNAGRDSNSSDTRSERSSQESQNPRSAPPPEPPSSPGNPLGSLSVGSLMKWIYWLIVGAVVGFLLWRYWREVATAIRAFLRDLASLWGRLLGGSEAGPSTVEQAAEAPPLPRPFSAYRSPFATGSAARYSPQQLVKYSFEALQAWAQERNCGKLPEQTPLEFALRVGARDARIGPFAKDLASLYNQAAYANDPLPATTVDQLRQLWAALQGSQAPSAQSRNSCADRGRPAR